MVVTRLMIPKNAVGLAIGVRGKNRKQVHTSYDVTMTVLPTQGRYASVEFQGSAENCAKAEKWVTGLLSDYTFESRRTAAEKAVEHEEARAAAAAELSALIGSRANEVRTRPPMTEKQMLGSNRFAALL